MARQTHEVMTQSEPPSVKQLQRLTAHVLLFAQRHDRLRVRVNTSQDKKRFFMSPTIHYDTVDVKEGDVFGHLVQHQLAGLAVKNTSEDDLWKLRIVNRVHVTDHGSGLNTNSTFYSFDWKNNEVLTARRKCVVLPRAQPEDLLDAIEAFETPDDLGWIPEMADEYEFMRPDDVTQLLRQVDASITAVDAGHRVYRERRRKYEDYMVP